MVESAAEHYPEADWQWCIVHFCSKMKEVVAMLKAMKLGKAAEQVKRTVEETLVYMAPSRTATVR